MSTTPKAGLLLAVAAASFCSGLLFQKYITIGRVISHFRKEVIHTPLTDHPTFSDSNTFCILALGQSNAANHGSSRAKAGANSYSLFEDEIYPPSDPLPGASGHGGSVWTRLAPLLLQEKNNQSVLIQSVAQGSSSIRSWTPAGKNFSRLKTAIGSFQKRKLAIDLVVIHQGETESWTSLVSGEDYQNQLASVLTSIRQLGCSAPVLVCQTSRDSQGTLNKDIRWAQASVWSEAKNIFAGVDTDTLGDDFRSDGVHFNAKGLQRFAELLHEALSQKSDAIPTSHPE